MKITAFLKDPLAHFLIAGALLFVAVSSMSPAPPSGNVVDIDRAAVLEFIQYRSKAFETATAEALLDSMDAASLDRLIEDYVEEEVLHREAVLLGLEANDYVIRQRLVEKLRFLVIASIPDVAPDDETLRRFYEAKKNQYSVEASVSFRHVFFSNKTRKAPGDEAVSAAATLDRAGDAAVLGDRFPFSQSYVERTRAAVAAEFGSEAAEEIFAAQNGAWTAPVLSPYGAHAVFVSRSTPAWLPQLDEIKQQVTEDYLRERRQAETERILAETVDKYDLRVAQDVQKPR